jgi:hypothetical protein
VRTTSPTRPATAPPAVAHAAAHHRTASDDGGGGSGGGGSSAGSSGSTDDRGGGACRIGEVEVGIEPSPAPAAGDTGTVSVTLANPGPACALDGFPAVTLTAGGTSAEVPADEAAPAPRLTLAEGGTASFTLTYVRGTADGTAGLAVRSAEFALPGDTATHRFPWSYGDVATTQDGTPDATVGPFLRTGD